MRNHILLICLLGSLLRLLYAWKYHPWEIALDQLAWEALLRDPVWSYDHLIHYPHEGGTLVIGLISRLIQPFTQFNSLAIIAFVLEFIIRGFQIYVVEKVFDRRLAIWFGLWSLFATPSMFPWATLNFGLHNLASFFPFALLLLLHHNRQGWKSGLLAGVFLAAACWFSYTNFILIPVYFLYQAFQTRRLGALLWAIPSLAAILGLHLLLRGVADPGFHLSHFELLSIRGKTFLWEDADTWARLYEVWFGPLADIAVSIPKSTFLPRWWKYVWMGTVMLGLLMTLVRIFQRKLTKQAAFPLLIVPFFLVLYALSPFYHASPKLGHFVSYRHLNYLLPILMVYALYGLRSWKISEPFVAVLLLLSLYGGIASFVEKPTHIVQAREAGWVLGMKMGHDPACIERVVAKAPYDRQEWMKGVGWGITLALFQDIDRYDHPSLVPKTQELQAIFAAFEPQHHDNLMEGMQFAFSHLVMPRLSKEVYYCVWENICE